MSDVAKALRECFINRIHQSHRDGETTTTVSALDPDALADYIEALEDEVKKWRPLTCPASMSQTKAAARALAALGEE